MAKQTINVGSSANDGTGDKIRVAFQKTNANFTELYDGKIDSVVAGTNVTVDNTDPLNPIVNATGGGGSQTLEQTLVLGNTTGGEDIQISDGDGVFMDNGSRLIKGVTDAGRGGAKGIALKCSIDYEYKWEAGILYVLEQDGFTVRETKYNFAITPTATDDSTKGFVVGSRWILDNGDLYICKDATSTAAVWELQIISGGGNGSLTYYLNGSVSQGTIGGNAYKEMNSVPVIGTGTDFTISSDGYIAQFLTDVADPNRLIIPAGNWNFETYFSATTPGGTPRFYIELYKYNGATLTLLASNSATPEYITGGTSIDLYFSALAVPYTVLLATDRLAVRFYVIHSGRTITMHTENSHLSEIITTFSTGVDSVNGKIGVVVLTTDDIADSVNKRYQTDAQETVNDATSSIQTQLNGKVNNTGTETIAGAKTFSSNISIPATGTPLILSVSSGGSVSGLDTTTYPSLSELQNVKGVTSAIQGQIDLRQPYAIARTTTAITFDVPAIYNSFSSPQTGTLTFSLVSPLAKIGVVQVIYLNVATFPTLTGWVNIGSRAFQPSVVNIIYAKWSEGSRVEYWVSKSTA